MKNKVLQLFCICISLFLISPTQASESNTKTLYLAVWWETIWKMDLKTQEVLNSFPVEGYPTGLALLNGILYVNTIFNNVIYAFNPETGELYAESNIEIILDGLTAIPESQMIAGIEPSFDQLETLHFFKVSDLEFGNSKPFYSMQVDIPGEAVRGLAYANGKLYISEESTEAIYVYDLDITGSNLHLSFSQKLPINFRAPGLAYDCKNLVAYDIGSGEIKTVSISTGETLDSFSLIDTGISDIVAGLEVQGSNCLDYVAIMIDIKPGSKSNSINLKSKGVVPVAILTTDSFDAATVDQSSLTFAGVAANQKGKSGNIGSFEDVDNDGDLDLVVQFPTADLNLTEVDTNATMKGVTIDGIPILGIDLIKVVP